jgi:hypothetical protein
MGSRFGHLVKRAHFLHKISGRIGLEPNHNSEDSFRGAAAIATPLTDLTRNTGQNAQSVKPYRNVAHALISIRRLEGVSGELLAAATTAGHAWACLV